MAKEVPTSTSMFRAGQEQTLWLGGPAPNFWILSLERSRPEISERQRKERSPGSSLFCGSSGGPTMWPHLICWLPLFSMLGFPGFHKEARVRGHVCLSPSPAPSPSHPFCVPFRLRLLWHHSSEREVAILRGKASVPRTGGGVLSLAWKTSRLFSGKERRRQRGGVSLATRLSRNVQVPERSSPSNDLLIRPSPSFDDSRQPCC